MLENLIFISAQPVDVYFLWQCEVQIVNFRKFDVAKNMHILVWYPEERMKEIQGWYEMSKKYPEVKFFYYKDEGVDLNLYIPQLRPHILKMHFEKFKNEFKDKIFFYHDSDIIFRELPNFPKLMEGPVCWQSDCSGYLDYSYMRRKEQEGKMQEEEGVKVLADIGGITPAIIKSYDGKTGGAQSILKGIDASYWIDVEDMSMAMRRALYIGVEGSINKKYFQSETAGWQSWTCDMWAVNFALWKRGIPTDISSELEFSWATDSAETYARKPIMHNAGATKGHSGVFYKGDWLGKSPIGKAIKFPPKHSASYFYVKAIGEVK